jgi:hypothetical protein
MRKWDDGEMGRCGGQGELAGEMGWEMGWLREDEPAKRR